MCRNLFVQSWRMLWRRPVKKLKFKEGQAVAFAQGIKYHTIRWPFANLQLSVKKIEPCVCDRVDSTSCVS